MCISLKPKSRLSTKNILRKGGEVLIVYKQILEQLKNAGWSTYRLQKEKIIPNGVIIRIRAGLPITTATVDKICELLDCQPNDIMEHKKEERD